MSSCPPPHRPCPQCNKSWSENAWWIFISIGFDALNVSRWPGDTYCYLWSLTVVYGFHLVLNIHPFGHIKVKSHSLHVVVEAKSHSHSQITWVEFQQLWGSDLNRSSVKRNTCCYHAHTCRQNKMHILLRRSEISALWLLICKIDNVAGAG